MNCNFHIEAAISIMLQYDLSILAVQEHTPWNSELLPGEIASIERHCDKYGFFISIFALQIPIIDKQLKACHQETELFEEERIIKCRFEISEKNFVTFIPVYGVPHSGGEKHHSDPNDCNEDNHLHKLTRVQDRYQKDFHGGLSNK